MRLQKGMIISKEEFIKDGEYAKEEYEGLLVSSDIKNGVYNIGVQIDEDNILLVDTVDEKEVHKKYHQLVPHIQEIQKEYL